MKQAINQKKIFAQGFKYVRNTNKYKKTNVEIKNGQGQWESHAQTDEKIQTVNKPIKDAHIYWSSGTCKLRLQ